MNTSRPDSVELPSENKNDLYDEHLLITREFTHVEPTDNELHRIGYYWPAQFLAIDSVK